METLEALARRMATAQDVRDLVRTMKLVAAVSIRQYERTADTLTAYERPIELGLRALLREDPHLATAAPRHARPRTAAIVLGSDQGLCGTFNEQTVRRLKKDLDAGTLTRGRFRLLAVGARVVGRLEEIGLHADHAVGMVASAQQLPVLTEDLVLVLDGWQDQGEHLEVLVYGSRPVPVGPARAHRVRLLPLAEERRRELAEAPWPTRMLPRRTVDRPVLLGELVRQELFVSLTRLLAWSAASEHASRLAAMQAAEHNIDERLDGLRRAYHGRRQTAITTEMLDIVAGAEAVGTA
jgi:F-type H+-transporting ATPase subunit gamma